LAASNAVSSRHIRCKITASLRARATLAFFIPARLESFSASFAAPLSGPAACKCDRLSGSRP
jgi:hypothetical protein